MEGESEMQKHFTCDLSREKEGKKGVKGARYTVKTGRISLMESMSAGIVDMVHERARRQPASCIHE